MPPRKSAKITALSTIPGGDGQIPEPDWSGLFTDELDFTLAREQWGVVSRELRDNEKLAVANTHQIKRLVVAYVMYEIATRRIADQGAVMKAKRSSVPQYNPWWSILKDAHVMAVSLESELTISPRRRAYGSKVAKRKTRTTAADQYLRPVAG